MKLVPNAISTKIARQALLSRKSAPSVLFAAGVAGMIGSTVLACRATLKLEVIMVNTRGDLDLAKRRLDQHEKGLKMSYTTGEPTTYTQTDYRNDVTVIYARAFNKAFRPYIPAIVLGAAAIGCLTKSHNLLNQRNAALTAAYVAVDEAFTRYRQRVTAKYGETQDREFRYGVEEVEVIHENGKMTTEKQVGPDGSSMYARFFDEYSTSWSKEAEYNFVFLRCQQAWANNMLIARGHVFLNEVYDALGLPRSQAGSVVGWVVSEGGDNFIDFGIFSDREGRGVRDFINGRNGSILLDFNVDGIIYDKIDMNTERLKWQS
jgi:hypothetical protein